MRIVDPHEAVAGIASGQQVFVHGGAATPSVLLEAVVRHAPELHDVGVIHFHIEGPGPPPPRDFRDQLAHEARGRYHL